MCVCVCVCVCVYVCVWWQVPVAVEESVAIPRCRFYENEFPEAEEVVQVNVTSIEELGAYVTLLEYNNIQGMVVLSELSRRRIRSIHKLISVRVHYGC